MQLTPPGRMDAALARLSSQPITAAEKGFALIAASQEVTAASLAATRPLALGGAFTMPLLLLRDSALRRNAAEMARWCADAGLLVAPHGKTTMAPQLIARQLGAGAWGITVATVGHAQVFRRFGVDRILIANQVTDPAGIAWLAAQLGSDQAGPGEFDCYAYVDSLAGVRLLDQGLRAGRAARPLNVLIELGFPGGRTGCRTVADAVALAAAVGATATLRLAGAAGYEGGLGRDSSQATLDAVASFCRQLRALARTLAADLVPAGSGSGPIVTAGGSAYFDVVARELTAAEPTPGAPRPFAVLRSGCYLTHDHGLYSAIGPNSRQSGPQLTGALELWAPVLSRPEPELAIACAGRRDAGFDQGFPIPLRVREAGGRERGADGMRVTRLDDQHAYVFVPAGAELAPGDLFCLGISHPCTTMDKWRVIPVVDDDYRVIDAVHTFF